MGLKNARSLSCRQGNGRCWEGQAKICILESSPGAATVQQMGEKRGSGSLCPGGAWHPGTQPGTGGCLRGGGTTKEGCTSCPWGHWLALAALRGKMLSQFWLFPTVTLSARNKATATPWPDPARLKALPGAVSGSPAGGPSPLPRLPSLPPGGPPPRPPRLPGCPGNCPGRASGRSAPCAAPSPPGSPPGSRPERHPRPAPAAQPGEVAASIPERAAPASRPAPGGLT